MQWPELIPACWTQTSLCLTTNGVNSPASSGSCRYAVSSNLGFRLRHQKCIWGFSRTRALQHCAFTASEYQPATTGKSQIPCCLVASRLAGVSGCLHFVSHFRGWYSDAIQITRWMGRGLQCTSITLVVSVFPEFLDQHDQEQQDTHYDGDYHPGSGQKGHEPAK